MIDIPLLSESRSGFQVSDWLGATDRVLRPQGGWLACPYPPSGLNARMPGQEASPKRGCPCVGRAILRKQETAMQP